MNSILKWSGVVALVILAIMAIAHFWPSSQEAVGTAVDCQAVTCFTTVGILTSLQVDGTTIYNGVVQFLSGLKVGSTGTTLSTEIGTTCNLIGSDASQAASSTVAYDCAVTGLTSSFTAFAQLSTTTVRTAQSNWDIVASKASSTAGFLTVLLFNGGPAAVPSASAVGSSTKVWAFQ